MAPTAALTSSWESTTAWPVPGTGFGGPGFGHTSHVTPATTTNPSTAATSNQRFFRRRAAAGSGGLGHVGTPIGGEGGAQPAGGVVGPGCPTPGYIDGATGTPVGGVGADDCDDDGGSGADDGGPVGVGGCVGSGGDDCNCGGGGDGIVDVGASSTSGVDGGGGIDDVGGSSTSGDTGTSAGALLSSPVFSPGGLSPVGTCSPGPVMPNPASNPHSAVPCLRVDDGTGGIRIPWKPDGIGEFGRFDG
ncbi:hypothetical protein GCM10029964_064540 [Kibdelosporangium lantanae]